MSGLDPAGEIPRKSKEFDPVGMGFPDPSDFKQSDEYASEYEEDQRVRELLKRKLIYSRWSRILFFLKEHFSWKVVIKIITSIYVVIVPIFWFHSAIFVEHAHDRFIVIAAAFAVTAGCYLAYAVLFLLIWLMTKLPDLYKFWWRWIWDINREM